MVTERNNIVLIGMPGAGKSTVGVILAKRAGLQFFDTDLMIQGRERMRLQQVINSKGLDYFRYVEEQVITNLALEYSVIATGGSAVYYPKGMDNLRQNGPVIYLQVSLAELEKRIADMGQRGLVMGKGQNFADLFAERTPLYKKQADVTVQCDGKTAEEVAAEIELQISEIYPGLISPTGYNGSVAR